MDEFRPETGSIGRVLKLSFQPFKERPNLTPYATWASVLVLTARGLRNRLEVDVVWASNWLGPPLLTSERILQEDHSTLYTK